MNIQTLIVGSGLSGLRLADKLSSAGKEFLLVEASDHLGGRIESVSSGTYRYDLGPSWVWPGQPLLEELVDELGLQVFEQYQTGNLVLQEADGSVRRNIQLSTMPGSLRVSGGTRSLVEGILSRIPLQKLCSNEAVTRLELTHEGINVTTSQRQLLVQDVVLAAPPRLVARKIEFLPPLDQQKHKALENIPTWMAGQAKFFAVYEKPFWRAKGLSGDGISRLGPMVEIHDASPSDAGEGALFGFLGVPAMYRAAQEEELQHACLQQLVQMFGAEAGFPTQTFYRDWYSQPFVATEADGIPLGSHPAYGLPAVLVNIWDERIILASTEMSSEHGGLLEGALEGAERAFRRIR